jgi:alginate O-acetyltransferase complex protein AlgI
VVLIGWVFFRSTDLASAMGYLASMFGLRQPQPGSVLIDGILRQPYYLLCFVIAAILVWGGRDVWVWTRRLTPARGLACLGLLWLALVAMATQGYNPFIYFIF